MKSFYVIIYDINHRTFVPYDVIPYLKKCYYEAEDKPNTLEEFKNFIKSQSMYQWGSRCEYEIILSDWPSQHQQKKNRCSLSSHDKFRYRNKNINRKYI